jgi:hypothetical protein
MAIPNARQVAALVPMSALLEVLGFSVNERTRRCACPLHGGSNPTAFTWTDAGLWKSHSCGAGGDRIALVRAMQQCGFSEAMTFLAALAGVQYRFQRASRGELERARLRRARAERAAWKLTDEIARLRIYYTDALHRADLLCWRLGQRLCLALSDAVRETLWEVLAQLAPAQTFFLAAWHFIRNAAPDVLARFALATAFERRRYILEGNASWANTVASAACWRMTPLC